MVKNTHGFEDMDIDVADLEMADDVDSCDEEPQVENKLEHHPA